MKDENIIEPEWEADRRESGRERRRREEREREALRAAAQQLADMQGRRDVSLDDDDTVELRGGRPGGDASFDGGNVAVRDARRGRDRDASLDEADEENVVELRGARRRHRDTPREDPDVVELRPSASGIAAGAGDAATGAAGVDTRGFAWFARESRWRRRRARRSRRCFRRGRRGRLCRRGGRGRGRRVRWRHSSWVR